MINTPPCYHVLALRRQALHTLVINQCTCDQHIYPAINRYILRMISYPCQARLLRKKTHTHVHQSKTPHTTRPSRGDGRLYAPSKTACTAVARKDGKNHKQIQHKHCNTGTTKNKVALPPAKILCQCGRDPASPMVRLPTPNRRTTETRSGEIIQSTTYLCH